MVKRSDGNSTLILERQREIGMKGVATMCQKPSKTALSCQRAASAAGPDLMLATGALLLWFLTGAKAVRAI